jgi:hypothetical protein
VAFSCDWESRDTKGSCFSLVHLLRQPIHAAYLVPHYSEYLIRANDAGIYPFIGDSSFFFATLIRLPDSREEIFLKQNRLMLAAAGGGGRTESSG